MPIWAPVGGRPLAAISGHTTGVCSEVIRHTDSGASAAARPRNGPAGPRRDTERIGAADEKLAAGRALVRPAVAACVTVPATWPVAEHGRRLNASIRAAGYVPLRLDLAQDSGFAAAAIPLGVGLPHRRGRR